MSTKAKKPVKAVKVSKSEPSSDSVFQIEKGLYPESNRKGSPYLLLLVNTILKLKPKSNEFVTISKSICKTKSQALSLALAAKRHLKKHNAGVEITTNTVYDSSKNYVAIRIWRML